MHELIAFALIWLVVGVSCEPDQAFLKYIDTQRIYACNQDVNP